MTDAPNDNPTPDAPDEGQASPRSKAGKSSRFIIRGMATLLPAVLTLWLLVFAYGFIRDKIAAPINWGVQALVIQFTDWPVPTDDDYLEVWDGGLTPSQREAWEVQSDERRRVHQEKVLEQYRRDLAVGEKPASVELPPFRVDDPDFEKRLRLARLDWLKGQEEIIVLARREQLQKKWDSIAVGNWHVLDLIGLIVAVVLFYFAGAVMSNVIGRQLRDRGERLIDRVPLIRRVYPAVKQVTDFFFGDNEQQLKFNRVVAVEYPRKGLFSVGLVTGDTMRDIEAAMGEPCLTVFIPSSPTPFTGYVITVPVADTIDLNLTIEDALKFAVSGGVLVPPSQVIDRAKTEHDRRGPTGDRRTPADAPPPTTNA